MTVSAIEVQTKPAAVGGGKKKIALLGCGKMGTILLQALLERQKLSGELGGVTVSTDNRAAVSGAEIVLLCLKPQVLGQLLEEIAPAMGPKTLVISIAASTTTAFIHQKLGKALPVVRAMPNTPATVGAAMTAVSAGPSALPDHVETTKLLFESVGRAVVVDEKHMDAITALSASGPAFVFVACRSRRQSGTAARNGNHARRPNALRLGAAGAQNRASPRTAQRRGNHSRRMHHRRPDGAGERRPARNADECRNQDDDQGQRANDELGGIGRSGDRESSGDRGGLIKVHFHGMVPHTRFWADHQISRSRAITRYSRHLPKYPDSCIFFL